MLNSDRYNIKPAYLALAESLATYVRARLDAHRSGGLVDGMVDGQGDGQGGGQTDGLVVGIAGESGCGKSVTATSLAQALESAGLRTRVIHQDDYFLLPPRTNHERRLLDLAHVGPGEVNLALIASHVADFRAKRDNISAPEVDYPGNRFLTQRYDFSQSDVLIVEGTYVLQIPDLDLRIFLEATHHDTSARRRARNRDLEDPIVNQVLDIEHEIIARQGVLADIVIDRDFAIVRAP